MVQNLGAKEEQEREKVATVIDDDGVILNYLYAGDKIVSKKQQDYLNNNMINFQKGEAFVKMFTNPIIELYRTLDARECATIIGIVPFISYKDGILRCDNKIANIKTISEVLEENYNTFKKSVNILIKNQILAKYEIQSDTYQARTKQAIVVNPYIFLKGQDINKDIVELFNNSKWANIDKE